MKRNHSPIKQLRFFALTTLLITLIMVVFAGSVFAEEGSDSITGCELPEEVVVSIERQNNNVTIRWTTNSSDFYEVHAMQDDFYFEPSFFSFVWETEFNSFIFNDELGDPGYNSAYGIVAGMDCGATSGISNHVGSFNFALVPGS